MSDKPLILVQLDSDLHASVFDRVVAVDSGVHQLFAYASVKLEQVTALVHGCIFTRGPQDLKNTAIFIGGSDVALGEKMLAQVLKTFFGPMRVSVMMDANGCNTTAAAAVLAARKHLDLARTTATVLAGTGPVGQRAALLLASEGCSVRLASRSIERATATASSLNTTVGKPLVSPVVTAHDESIRAAVQGSQLVIAAGAAGIELLPLSVQQTVTGLQVLIDLNAVAPAGIASVNLTDKARESSGIFHYGALGVGGTKMKIHKAALASLFTANDRVLDASAIYQLGKSL